MFEISTVVALLEKACAQIFLHGLATGSIQTRTNLKSPKRNLARIASPECSACEHPIHRWALMFFSILSLRLFEDDESMQGQLCPKPESS